MPSRGTARVLDAIAHNITLARRFIEGMSYEAFATDDRTLYVKARHPDVPWRPIAGAGNIYRHDYEDVLATILWNTVRDHLHALENAVHREQQQSGNG